MVIPCEYIYDCLGLIKVVEYPGYVWELYSRTFGLGYQEPHPLKTSLSLGQKKKI